MRMSTVSSMATELGNIEKQRDNLSQWISSMESSVADSMQKPPKFRKDALESEMKKFEGFSESLLEKQNILEQNFNNDQTLRDRLDSLSNTIYELKEKRNNQYMIIEEYRYHHQQFQTWLDDLTKSLTGLDESQTDNTEDRRKQVEDLMKTFEGHNDQSKDLLTKGDAAIECLDEMDQQLIKEQIKTIERRTIDVKKRLERRSQIVDMACSGLKNTKDEIEETQTWIHSKTEELNTLKSKDQTSDTLNECRAFVKEVENKVMLFESLEAKIERIASDIDASEHKHLKESLSKISDDHKKLDQSSKIFLLTLEENSGNMKKLEDVLHEIQNWLKTKCSELHKSSEHDPLKSVEIEKKVSLLKKDLFEVGEFEETKVSQLRLGLMGLQKSSSPQRESQEKQSRGLETSLATLKEELKNRLQYLENELTSRRDFESDIDACNIWIDQAETILSTEVRGTINLAVLDDHHNKFKRLKVAEEENRNKVAEVFQTANSFLDKLSDADRISLQTKLDEVCDRQNYVADNINAKISNLVRNIEVYKNTAQKIEDSVNHLTEIQTQIRLLNKPIGYRVEDAEDVLEAYAKILDNLKAFKIQMEDLQRTAGSNVTEVGALLGQQDELIAAIENQMAKIRNLIGHRHQFMTMVTGITSFIIKHTEVVKQVERSSIPPMEKVKKYDESILKLKDCETQLALASDKGQQIANEGSAADRNQISHQLQSLKTQIIALQKAIEKKRDEHFQSVQKHNKFFGELETFLEWIQSRELQVRERPVLTTTVENVEECIAKHDELTNNIMEYVENIRKVIDGAKKEQDISSSSYNLLSSVTALIQALPRELQDTKQYLDNNKNYRLQYDSLTERLNNWVEEAQIKLRPLDSGIDFDNLQTDLEEHKKYFGQESKLKELLHSIHDMANKIWASLAPKDQDKINHEQEFFTQLVKNTLNSANSRQTEFEQNLKLWKEYSEHLESVKAVLDDISYEDSKKPSSLSSVKSSLAKIDLHLKKIQTKKSVIEQFSSDSKKLETLADTINKHKISETLLNIQTTFKTIQSELESQREELSNIDLQWSDFEEKYKSFDSKFSVCQQQFKDMEMSFNSSSQLSKFKSDMTTMLEELQTMQSCYNDLQILSSNVLRYFQIL